jgi:mannan endo-1,4-beta-mannosidase
MQKPVSIYKAVIAFGNISNGLRPSDNVAPFLLKCGAFLLLLFISLNIQAQSFEPVNKNATPEAKSLLKYLYSINGKAILSGEHGGGNRFLDSTKAITGKYPALWGSDFIWSWPNGGGQRVVNEAIANYKKGYIIALMWHQGRPMDKPPYGFKESVQAKMTDEEWEQLITPNTNLNKKWLAQVDTIASYLKQLQDAHVPVLWRPYHEMNGVWFWWGNRPGKNGVQKLWKMMYDRFVNYHHLNNLLWVWGANGPRDIPLDEAYSYKGFYPGANYVDILGADIYHSDYEQKDYNELLKLANGKIIALTEVGELPKPEILAAQPAWAWFMIWTNFLWQNNTHQQVNAIFSRPETISLGDKRF